MPMLKDRVAIITGASAGIGRAIAMTFAAEGSAVVLNGRNRAALDKLARTIRSNGAAVQVVAGT